MALEIANGLLSLEQALVGGSPDDDCSDLPALISDPEDDDSPVISNPDIVKKYNLDCPDWLSFKSNCKSVEKYCTRVEDAAAHKSLLERK